jgi:uncharacterized protein (DUF2344 family)
MCNIEYKKSIIESTLASSRLYYDDRIRDIETAPVQPVPVSTTGNQTNQSPGMTHNSTGSALSGIKKKLSSKKKKEKKMNELKINEDNDKENAGLEANIQLDSNQYEFELNDDADDNDLETLIKQLAPNELAQLLVTKIDKKSQLLERLWQELNKQALIYNNILINFYQNVQQISKSFEIVNQKLNENEKLVAQISTSNEIESEKLAQELERIKNLQLLLSSYQPLIDDMSLQYTNIIQELQNCSPNGKAMNTQSVILFRSKFDDLNLRWSNLQNQLQEKYLNMYSLVESSGANIFLKLAESVQSPWQRSISATNKVPYYMK